MVERNLTLPYEFICFTDDTNDLNTDIKTIKLPNIKTTGWWYKLSVFDQLPMSGTMLFLDLDLVIFKNIDYLFSYNPGKFCIIRDFNRSTSPSYRRMNSSVFRFQINSLTHIYKTYIQNTDAINRRFRGDQDYIETQITDFSFWPDEWIRSYKWEMRDRRSVVTKNGRYTFSSPSEPILFPESSIAVFHGSPNPHECDDIWVKESWV